MADTLCAKNLIQWEHDGGALQGTLLRVDDAGRRVVVRLDEGGEKTFVWPSEVIERVVLPEGDHVRVPATGAAGVEPDPESQFRQVETKLPPSVFAQFRRLCRRVGGDELCALRPKVLKRREQLVLLAQKHRFNVRLAVNIANALAAALKDLDRYSASELNLLSGAAEYFLLFEDDAHDLTNARGFDDDAQVAASVLEVIGRIELKVELDPGVPA